MVENEENFKLIRAIINKNKEDKASEYCAVNFTELLDRDVDIIIRALNIKKVRNDKWALTSILRQEDTLAREA